MQIIPRLNFTGHGEAAAEFYQEAFGITPVKKNDGEEGIRLQGRDLSIRVSDGQSEEGVALEVAFHYSDDAQHAFDTLTADGGRVRVALGETTENHLYGSVTDRFGVTWHIILE